MHFGARLLQILEDKNMSQRKLSKEIDYHAGMISKVINGKRPSGELIYKILNKFPDKLEYLFADITNSPLVNEDAGSYNAPVEPTDIISEIEEKLTKLRNVLSHK